MTTKVYLMRHGKVENPKNLAYGTLPGFPLSVEGIEQIKVVAQKFKEESVKFDAIFSSPLKRTVDTAEIMALETKFEGQIVIDNRLMETDAGIYSGKAFSKYEQAKKNRSFNLSSKQLANGEKVLDLFNDLLQNYYGKTILAVSHCDTILDFLNLIREDDYHVGKGSFFLIESSNDQWQIIGRKV